MNRTISPQSVRIPLDRDLFLRKLLRELTGLLEDVVGVDEAAGYISSVGSAMGTWIDEQYRSALDVESLSPEQIAQVFVDLKERIGGSSYIISIDSDQIVVGNRTCPFGEHAFNRPSLCMMTSNVFGRIAADNLGYARVELQNTIATRSKECRIVVHLFPKEGSDTTEREYYKVI